jgi:DNA-binding transcriptional LysR family regulator
MTQPGVSQHIKKLESSCGYSLLKRENKGFELTIEGKMIYEYSQNLANEEAKLIEKLSFDSPYSGKTLLSCSGSLALLLYPKLLELQEEHTDLSIFLEAAPNQKIFNDLQSGVIDLGIVTQLPNSSFYQSEIIGSEPLCLVLPSSYKGEK